MRYNLADRMSLVKPSSIRELLKLSSDPEIISFGGGFPDPEVFPIDKLKRVFDRVLTEQGKNALQYTASEGIPGLREKLVARMNNTGVRCEFDNIIIIQGAQQGLDLIAKAFINKGDVIIVERPTFLGALVAFNPYEPVYRFVNMDDNGMIMEELERVLKETPNAKFIYTIPEFHNPTGRTMPLERRKRLIELASQHDVMILEDSPYREIRYEGASITPIKSFDTDGRVVYLGSFSKILSPGLRMGWLVAEASLTSKLCQLKMAADTQNSTLNMFAINCFLEMYDIEEHIETIRKIYRRKKDLMLDTIQKTFPKSIKFTNPQGGLFTWLTFPEGSDAAEMMKGRLLPEAKAAYVPGTDFYTENPELNHARVNYSFVPDEKIVYGITRMGEIFTDYFGR